MLRDQDVEHHLIADALGGELEVLQSMAVRPQEVEGRARRDRAKVPSRAAPRRRMKDDSPRHHVSALAEKRADGVARGDFDGWGRRWCRRPSCAAIRVDNVVGRSRRRRSVHFLAGEAASAAWLGLRAKQYDRFVLEGLTGNLPDFPRRELHWPVGGAIACRAKGLVMRPVEDGVRQDATDDRPRRRVTVDGVQQEDRRDLKRADGKTRAP